MSEYVMEYDGWAEGIPAGEYLKVRNAMHARKREEIVRCRDCKQHIDTPKRGCRCYRWITLDCYENPVPSEVEPNGFCAWGERRDDA